MGDAGGMRYGLKLLVILTLSTQASWACGVGMGPEGLLLVLGALVAGTLPVLLAPLLGMLLVRRRHKKFTLGAGLCIPVGWACSMGSVMLFGVPGYFVGLMASVGIGMSIASRFQILRSPDAGQPGFSPAP